MLIVSGFDSTAQAGILLDSFIAKLFNIQHACIFPTLTMQNHTSHYGTQTLNLQKQLECVNFVPSVVKVGLLYSTKNIEILAQFLQQFPNAKIIADTPLISSSGKMLVENMNEYIKTFQKAFLKKTFLLTPNLQEAKLFGGLANILNHGCSNVLIKGGHSTNQNSTDFLHSQNSIQEFSMPRINLHGQNVRGTGCGLSTAIACHIHKGQTLENAIMQAKKLIHHGILHSQSVSEQTKTLNFNGFQI